MRVTPEEHARLAELASAQRVSVPRLLVESALSEQGETPTQRREAMAELFAVHRVLSGMAVNLNQLARHANAGEEFPVQARHAVTAMRPVVTRLSAVLERLAQS